MLGMDVNIPSIYEKRKGLAFNSEGILRVPNWISNITIK